MFLTRDKVKPEELQANASVIVEALPAPVELILAAPDMPADHIEHVSNSCAACHTEGIREAPVNPANHADYKDGSCTGCHKLQK
jgi:cytochrome c5